MSVMYTCDLCGGDENNNNQLLSQHVYGVMGCRSTPDYSEMKINKSPTFDDDFHFCHGCLEKLKDEFLKLTNS